jgi:hypothetical protein
VWGIRQLDKNQFHTQILVIHYEFFVIVRMTHDFFICDDFSDEIERPFRAGVGGIFILFFAETLPFHPFVWGSFEQLRLQSLQSGHDQ